MGDFGLAREVNAGRSTSTLLTSTVLGTSAYMPPEAFRGDVSVKLDTFSFGIVSNVWGAGDVVSGSWRRLVSTVWGAGDVVSGSRGRLVCTVWGAGDVVSGSRGRLVCTV